MTVQPKHKHSLKQSSIVRGDWNYLQIFKLRSLFEQIRAKLLSNEMGYRRQRVKLPAELRLDGRNKVAGHGQMKLIAR